MIHFFLEFCINKSTSNSISISHEIFISLDRHRTYTLLHEQIGHYNLPVAQNIKENFWYKCFYFKKMAQPWFPTSPFSEHSTWGIQEQTYNGHEKWKIPTSFYSYLPAVNSGFQCFLTFHALTERLFSLAFMSFCYHIKCIYSCTLLIRDQTRYGCYEDWTSSTVFTCKMV